MSHRILLLLLLLLLTGCTATPAKNGAYFDPDAADIYRGNGPRRDYRLTLEMGFEKKPYYVQWVEMDLAFSAWREAHAQRFVLERQHKPAYTLFTYYKGLFSKTFSADVKTLVEIRDARTSPQQGADMARAEARGREALARWRTRYPRLIEKYQFVEDPKIIYFSPAKLRGRFGFYRTHEGDLIREASGQVRSDTMVNNIEEVYRWHTPDKPDPVKPSNFFKGLQATLEAWETSPFPDGDPEALDDTEVGERWTADNTYSIQAFVNGVVKINSLLRSAIDTGDPIPFKMTYTLTRREGAVVHIESQTRAFESKASLGQGYALTSFQRIFVYDTAQQVVLEDTVSLRASSEEGDEILMRLRLVEASR